MSLETWKEEFYFVDASDVPVEHSLRKWIGLRQENLDKHGIIIGDGYGVHLHDGVNSFDIDSTSCALCVHYLHAGEYECVACPLNLT